MIVMKFGGSCLAKPARLRHACNLMSEAIREGKVIAVVCSALGGVTNQILELFQQAATRQPHYRTSLDHIIARHRNMVSALFDSGSRPAALAAIQPHLTDLSQAAETIYNQKDTSLAQEDLILGFGELLSTQIVAHYLQQSLPVSFLDGRKLIQTNSHFGQAKVDEAETTARILNHFQNCQTTQIVTGFISQDQNGAATTLGRGGSDYTAALIGAALGCESIEIWTDVDGFMTADPRLVPDAIAMRELSFEAAKSLAHFGAKVIYAPTLSPAMAHRVPVLVKNCFAPRQPGTLIHQPQTEAAHPLAGLASLDTIVQIQLTAPVGQTLVQAATGLYRFLVQEEANLTFATQSSDQLTLYVDTHQPCWQALEDRLRNYLSTEQAGSFAIRDDLALIALVGNRPLPTGLINQALTALERARTPPHQVCQFDAGHCLCIAVRNTHQTKAMRRLHRTFFDPSPANPTIQAIHSPVN